MTLRSTARPPSPPPHGRVSTLDLLSGHGPTLLVVPTAVTVALGVALFAGLLGIQWVVLGAILVGPFVVTAIVAFEGLKTR